MPDYLLPSNQDPKHMVLARSQLPLESVSCCPHCGAVMGTKVDGDVTLHLVDPGFEGFSDLGFSLRPPPPPRTLSADSSDAQCPYCGREVTVDTLVQRDPEDFLTFRV
jgi:hypothetical protein